MGASHNFEDTKPQSLPLISRNLTYLQHFDYLIPDGVAELPAADLRHFGLHRVRLYHGQLGEERQPPILGRAGFLMDVVYFVEGLWC